MTTFSASVTRFNPSAFVRRSFAANPLLTAVGLAMVGLLVIAVVGLAVDRQFITGAPAFLKPLKFAVSTFIYVFTLLYLLTFIQGHRRLVSIIANASAVGLGIELALIFMQVMRGTTSHFNYATTFDATVFEIMATFIIVVFTMALIVAFLLVRQKLSDPAWAWALRLGMLLALVGMAVAFLMTLPTAAQINGIAASGHLATIGGHTVGAPDGGPGLPILGWSTVGGDLRVPHFFGLHGLQVMLIVGWLVLATKGWLDARHRVALTITAGVGYLGLIILLTWQALRGQSLVKPDALTLSVFVLLGVATLLTLGITLWHGRHLHLASAPQHITLDR